MRTIAAVIAGVLVAGSVFTSAQPQSPPGQVAPAAILLAKEGDHVALPALEPSEQRGEENHAQNFAPLGALSQFLDTTRSILGGPLDVIDYEHAHRPGR